MTRENYNKAQNIMADIQQIEKRLKIFQRILEVEENGFAICTSGKIKGEHNNVDALYLKDDVEFDDTKKMLCDYWENLISQKEKELSEL